MKKVICLILAMAFTLTAFACGGNYKPLNSPTNVKISEDGVITWDAVANAAGYVVHINDDNYNTYTNSYKVESVDYDFKYSVTAFGKGFGDSKPSAEQVFKGKLPPVNPDKPNPDKPDPEKPNPGKPEVEEKVVVTIKGANRVLAGNNIILDKEVNSFDASVEWKIVSGSQYVENSEIFADKNDDYKRKLKITTKNVKEDAKIKVRCTSKHDRKAFAEKEITIFVKPKLTDEMLSKIALSNKVLFDGYIDIKLYKVWPTISKEPDAVMTSTLKTAMDGNRWYAEYSKGNGLKGKIYYKNKDGIASQVGVSFTNEEKYYPMLNDDGSETTWEEAGLYNNFTNLKASDFEFDLEKEMWVYKKTEDKANIDKLKKIIASANPYTFVPKNLGLIIEDGEIAGIISEAEDDKGMQVGHVARQVLTVSLSYGHSVIVPSIDKFETKEGHKELNEAIKNMQSLTSYKVDYKEVNMNLQTQLNEIKGITETILEDVCYYQPYELIGVNGKIETKYQEKAEYGYKKFDDITYNSFHTDKETGKFVASRAFQGNFNEAKPSFLFAGEIFTTISDVLVNEKDNTTYREYFVAPEMMAVASRFYKGVGNDVNLYGLYASIGYESATRQVTPYVVVKQLNGKNYITNAGFYYNLGIIRGKIELEYSDFGSAKLPEKVKVDFEKRNTPLSWADKKDNEGMFQVIVNDSFTDLYKTFKDIKADEDKNPNTDGFKNVITSDKWKDGDDMYVYAPTFFEKFFGNKEIADSVPFFGAPDILGDTFGLMMTTMYIQADEDGTLRNHKAVMLFYDVPLDEDYSVNSSIKKVQDALIKKGYTRNKQDVFKKGQISIKVVDDALDLKIYIW